MSTIFYLVALFRPARPNNQGLGELKIQLTRNRLWAKVAAGPRIKYATIASDSRKAPTISAKGIPRIKPMPIRIMPERASRIGSVTMLL